MKHLLTLVSILSLFGISFLNPTLAYADMPDNAIAQADHDHSHDGHDHSSHAHAQDAVAVTADKDPEAAAAHGAATHAEPAMWSVIPFILLLLMVATGPLFYAHFWHKYYPAIAIILGTMVVVYYVFFLHDQHHPVHAFAEYFSFIALLTPLFVASGGILIKIDKAGTPWVNVVLLVIGAAMANIIGTTGASMLLIRPFIRLNKDRIKPYHVVFFIFIVSNVGGSLTPVGDPPLFLGFLKGIPFFWTLEHIWPMWFFGVGLLALIFYFVDKKNHTSYSGEPDVTHTGKLEVKGIRNTIFLAITIGAVFLDPNVLDWVPAINYHGDKLSFLREIIMLTTAVVAYKTSDKESLKGNEFNFEPIKEVAFLFVGIFATMMPALQLIGDFARTNPKLITVDSLYWATGGLSGVLDNAPTYLNFLAAGMGKEGMDIGSKAQVMEYANDPETLTSLLAISVASVFFGAFTYIGNAPNFMVKAIAEQVGIQMPSFIGYIVRYSVVFLLPVLLLTWVVFFFLM